MTMIAVFDITGPLVAYNLLRSAGFRTVTALVLSGVFPAAGVIIGIIQRRMVDAFGVLVLAGIAVGAIMGLVPAAAVKPERGRPGPARLAGASGRADAWSGPDGQMEAARNREEPTPLAPGGHPRRPTVEWGNYAGLVVLAMETATIFLVTLCLQPAQPGIASSDLTRLRDVSLAGTWMTAIRSGWSTRRSWNICSVISPAWGWLIPMAAGRKYRMG